MSVNKAICSEENESFLDITINSLSFFTEYIEAYGLREGAALSNSYDVTNGETESGRFVAGNSLVSLFKSVVLSNEMEIIASDDNIVSHFV
jgi:hypothetical protein